MPTLRLFADLREAAGVSSADVDGATVGEVLDAARRRFGERFAVGVEAARVWVNGEPADDDTPVRPGDEIALIPPVSGGTTATSLGTDPNLLPVALVTALLVAAWIPIQWFVVVAAGAVMAWSWDLHDAAAARGRRLPLYPLLVGPVLAAAGSYAWGPTGYAGGVAAAIAFAVAWPVFSPPDRPVTTTAAGVALTVLAATASGSLVLLGLTSTEAVVAFVVVTLAGLVGAALGLVYGTRIQSVDPNVGALLGTLLAGVAVGLAVAGIELSASMLAAVFAAAGIIAGRALGAMVRIGVVVHTARPPGRLAAVDGLVVAAPLFWLALRVFGAG